MQYIHRSITFGTLQHFEPLYNEETTADLPAVIDRMEEGGKIFVCFLKSLSITSTGALIAAKRLNLYEGD